jgi:hypothetical protein
VRAADATPVFSTQAAVRGPVTLTVKALVGGAAQVLTHLEAGGRASFVGAAWL